MNEGRVQIATVASLAPLEVRPKGRLVDVPVAHRTVAVPGDLAVGQQVLIVVLDRQVTFLGRRDGV